MLGWFERRQVYVPLRRMVAGPADLHRPFEDVALTSIDGVFLNGWYFPAFRNSFAESWVILMLHGNAGNISTRFDYYEMFLETGASVFTLDYRGFGQSPGHPSERGTYLDAQAACGWLEQKGHALKSIVAFGESLGGGVATELALREQIGGLVLQGTFTSIPDLGCELYPWLPVRWLGKIQYDTHSKLTKIRIPVMVMHSRRDRLIRFHHAERNFAAAREPKLFWEIHGDHTKSIETDRDGFLLGLNSFLDLLSNIRRNTDKVTGKS
jgi:uncharacterized protein